jgi:hypothetical protein
MPQLKMQEKASVGVKTGYIGEEISSRTAKPTTVKRLAAGQYAGHLPPHLGMCRDCLDSPRPGPSSLPLLGMASTSLLPFILP